MRKTKGFTLIELLVVIAIIGILSAIVLASLNTARTKANAAKVQSQLASLRAAAEVYYSTAGNYGPAVSASTCATSLGGIFGDTTSGGYGLINAITGTTGVTASSCTIGASGASWAATANMPGGSGTSAYWCVDSTGKSAAESSATFTSGACA